MTILYKVNDQIIEPAWMALYRNTSAAPSQEVPVTFVLMRIIQLMATSSYGKPLVDPMSQPVKPTVERGSDVFYCGTNANVGSGAVPLAAKVEAPGCVEVTLQNDPGSSTVNLLVGNQQGQFFVLTAGSDKTWKIDDISKLWVKSASTAITVNWTARGFAPS